MKGKERQSINVFEINYFILKFVANLKILKQNVLLYGVGYGNNLRYQPKILISLKNLGITQLN